MYTIASSDYFLRRSGKFFRKHPDLLVRFRRVIESLRHDPFQPQLRPHPLTGELDGLHALSLTYSYRVTLTLRVTGKEILLLDIGSHDEVYRP